MNGAANLLGLELIVLSIDDALAVLAEAFEWPIAYDGPSADVPGRVVVLDAGTVTITLLEPSDHGPGMLSDRQPRLSQLVVGGDGTAASAAVARLTALGLPSQSVDPMRRFVPPEAMAGVLGFETALTVQLVDEEPVEESGGR